MCIEIILSVDSVLGNFAKGKTKFMSREFVVYFYSFKIKKENTFLGFFLKKKSTLSENKKGKTIK